MRLWLFMVIMMAAFSTAPLLSAAQDEGPENEDHLPRLSDLAQAQYVNGILFGAFTGTQAQTELPYVLKITLEDEWYTYWRTPGDGGLAPTLDWSASTNVKDVVVGWPAPQRFEQDGLFSFGYKGIVEFPVTIIPADNTKPVDVTLNMSMVVCKKICVPQSLTIHHETPAGPAIQSPYYTYTKQVATSIPSHGSDKDIRLETAVLGKDALIITAYAKDGFDGADLFIESNDVLMTARPVVDVDGADPQKAVFKITAPTQTDLTRQLFGKEVMATLTTAAQSTEKAFSF